MAIPEPDDYGTGHFFTVKLDGAPVTEEANFKEVTGLNVFIDQTVFFEGGNNTNPVILPGPAKYENIVLKRGISSSKKFFDWIATYVNKPTKENRMSGSITLCKRDGTAIMSWTFEKGWPCRFEGPRLNIGTQEIVVECVEIAHHGLKLQPGDAAAAGGAAPAR